MTQLIQSTSTFHPFVNADYILVNHSQVTIQEMLDYGVIILRTGNSASTNNQIEKLLDIQLPEPLCQHRNTSDILTTWIAPDEYWLIVQQQQADTILQQADQLPKLSGALVNSLGSYGFLKLTGEQRHQLLARVMDYDFRSFVPGKAVSTTIGLASVMIYCPEEQPESYILTIRNSFAQYVSTLLKDTAKRL